MTVSDKQNVVLQQALSQVLSGSVEKAEDLLQRASSMRGNSVDDLDTLVVGALIALRKTDLERARPMLRAIAPHQEHADFIKRTIASSREYPPGLFAIVQQELAVRDAPDGSRSSYARAKLPAFLSVAMAVVVFVGGALLVVRSVTQRSQVGGYEQMKDAVGKVLIYPMVNDRDTPGKMIPAPYLSTTDFTDEVADAVGKLLGFDLTPGEPLSLVISGTSFALSRDGVMLTSKHVVDQETGAYSAIERVLYDVFGYTDVEWNITVAFGPNPDSEHYSASIVTLAENADLALIQADREFARWFRFAELAEPGDRVIAYGYPGSSTYLALLHNREQVKQLVHDIQFQLDTNIPMQLGDALADSFFVLDAVDGVVRKIEYTEEGWIVLTTAPISGGNSGGPIVTSSGRVLAVSTSGLSGVESLNAGIGWPTIQKELGFHRSLEFPKGSEDWGIYSAHQ